MPSGDRRVISTKLLTTILFIAPCLIWGSTWYVITFQLGTVDPVVSVCYRFAIAGVLVLGACLCLGLNLRFPARAHRLLALQGFCLFSLNYWLVYLAETHLMSGLVAVVFSLIIVCNILLGSLLLGMPIDKKVAAGAVLGISGTVLVFRSDLAAFEVTPESLFALTISLISVVLASCGNILSTKCQRLGVPVIQGNALSMTYGSIIMLLVALATGRELIFDPRPAYVLSLLYLAIFGSVVAFATYLKLLGTIGPDRGAYTILVVPIIALCFSSFFEGFTWTASAVLGIVLVLFGNILAMRSRRPRSVPEE